MNITLLWGGGEDAMHFSPNADQLDDPVVLPMRSGLHNFNLVLLVIKFDNFRFFSDHSLPLDGLGVHLGRPLLGGLCEIGHAASSTLHWWSRHEGVRVEERHVTTMVRKSWKEMWRRD
jgi:hypothetical protein